MGTLLPLSLGGAGCQCPGEQGKAVGLGLGNPQMNSIISLKAEPGRTWFQVASSMD